MARAQGPPASCYDRAVKLLARQESSRRRLAAKLRCRDYSEDEVIETLDRLVERGYLDDARYGRRWAEERLRKGPIGRRRLCADLGDRGLDSEIAAEIAAEMVDEDDLEAAREAADRWRRRRGGAPEALARHLDRLGFTSRAIGALVAEARSTSD